MAIPGVPERRRTARALGVALLVGLLLVTAGCVALDSRVGQADADGRVTSETGDDVRIAAEDAS